MGINMTVIGGILAFCCGSVFGSFANVLIVRMKDASSLWGRSRCVHCKVNIRPHHLVPILSWFVLGGRCADCKKPIHAQYPIVEFAGALLCLVAFLRHNPLLDARETYAFLFEFFFALDLLVLVAFDLRWRLLPIEFMIGSGFVFFLFRALLMPNVFSVTSAMLGVVVGAGFLGAQVLISRGKWMGMGDPWAGALIGATLGWPLIAYVLYATYIIGGIVAIFLFIGGFAKRGTRVPFAPFLAIGAMFAIWFGAQMDTIIGKMMS